MPFEFDIGSFRGQPNYLMRSKKGLYWYIVTLGFDRPGINFGTIKGTTYLLR